METLECLRSRVAVRAFRPDPIPNAVLRRVLEAGRWAPSSKNSQPWHFIVIQDRDRLRTLSRLTATGPFLAEAPLAIAVATIGAKMPLVDATRAIERMVLAAWDQGIGCCWIGNYDADGVKRLLGLPEEAVFITALPFGYPASRAIRGKQRRPLREIVHWERYGEDAPSDAS